MTPKNKFFVPAAGLLAVVTVVLVTLLSYSDKSTESVVPENMGEIPNVVTSELSSQQTIQTEDLNDLAKKIQYIVDCDFEMEMISTHKEISLFSDSGSIEKAWSKSDILDANLALLLSMNSISSAQGKDPDQNSLNEPIEPTKTQKLEQLWKQYPENKLLNYHFVQSCNDAGTKSICNEVNFDKALTNDPGNAALWFAIASRRATSDDQRDVIYALEQVVASPNYNEYWAESILLFKRALNSIGFTSHGPVILSAIGYSAALPVASIGGIFKFCKDNAMRRADIAQLCFDVGKKLDYSGGSFLTNSMGLSMQIQAAKAIDENELVSQLERKRKDSIRKYSDASKSSYLMLVDEALMEYWLQQLLIYGERKASKILYEEAIRLSKDPSYAPCPVREGFQN